jgi:hypothetical protein
MSASFHLKLMPNTALTYVLPAEKIDVIMRLRKMLMTTLEALTNIGTYALTIEGKTLMLSLCIAIT